MRIRRKSRITKLGFTFIVLLFLLSALSYSYAMWTETNQIHGSVGTMEDFNYLCLEGYYPFNETSGSITPDMSMSQNDGTVYGDANWLFAQGIGGCLYFDGDGDYVQIPDHDNLDITDEITVTGWVKVTSFESGRYYTISGKWNDRDGNYRGYLLGLSTKETTNPQPRFYISTDGTDFPSADSSLQLDLDTWYHLAGTYDRGNLKIYVNGELKGTTPLSGSIHTNDEPVLISGDRAGGNNGRFFNGLIDEVKIYSCCLSESEIQDIYDEESPLIT